MNPKPEFPAWQPSARLVSARIAVSLGFLLLGIGLGLWAVHIPLVQARLGLDPASLGFSLLVMAIGAVASMPLTGLAVAHYGSRRPLGALMIAFCVIFPLPILAGSIFLLVPALFILGVVTGGLDVALNVQASEIETHRGKPTMSSFHGFYSVGGLAGALIGAGIIAAGWGGGGGAMAVGTAAAIVAVLSARELLPSDRPLHSGPRFALPSRAVLGFGILAALSFAIEGAVHDWSTLFLSSVKLAGPVEAATGFALYSLAMASFRLSGDHIVARLGARLVVTLGGGFIVLGIAVAVLSPWALLGAVGFMLVGVGAANIVPAVFSASARTPGVAPSVGIAAVSTLGYSGFLIAPPLIGLVANGWGLSVALWLVALGGLIVAGVASRWKR